ncbi:MAG: cytochrome c oxidase assembly protein [Chloroflexota bacterium]
MSDWLGHPSIVLGLGALLFGYVWSIRARSIATRRPVVQTRTVVLFGLGLIVIYLSLASPLHDLSERYLFTAHMVQHLLLTMVVPPLLLLGTPGWMLSPLVRVRPLYLLARWLTGPLVAFIVFNMAFAISHMPALYDLTLGNHGAHIIEHLIFLGTAVLMWWPILSPMSELPRIAYPLQILYVFFQTIPSSGVGALITLSEQPLYRVYVEAPRVSELSALMDQQIGGALMWVGGGVYFLVLATIIFFIWANRENALAPA